MKGAIASFVVQLALLGVLIFGDIGFDHPGKYGLDFDNLVSLVAFYIASLLVGVVYAAYWRRWKLVSLQLATPVLLWFLLVIVPRFRPPLDAADYQHLVGKSRAEVRQSLGSRQPQVSGFEFGEGGSSEFEHYDGMSIFYAPSHTPIRNPRVVSVKPH